MNSTPASAELMKLCTTVARMQHRAIQDGIAPTEVWLGPEHDQTIRDSAGLRPGPPNVEGKDEFINGLRIRRSAEPGVWVAKSYGMLQ